MKAFLLFITGLTFNGILLGQGNFIKGKIVNGETGAGIANASVFITNTSRGTVSSSTGEFELTNVPDGTHDLVVSCISFETQAYTYKASQLPLRIQVQLKPKAEELEAVVIEPYEKDGWTTWGKFFTDNFIGTSDNARYCKIKNYQSLHFRNSKKRNELTVTADEPLIIENEALGYRIQYQLEGFSYNFKEHILLYFGYTLFSDLQKKGPRQWQLKNRKEAYAGSITDFMKSLYVNRSVENGFEIRRLAKTPNLEKERVRAIYRARLTDVMRNADSTVYFEKVLRQPDMFEKYGQSLLSADSLTSAVDSVSKSLYFENYLYITYKKATEAPAYIEFTAERRKPFFQRSVVMLLDSQAIRIDGKGNYYMPQNFMSYGYWGWSEKISSMLPLDYDSNTKIQ